MKSALLVAAMLAFGAVSANAGNDQRHALSLDKGRHRIESTVMTVGAPAGGSIDERPASALYRQNLHDSGYDAKNDFVAGHTATD
ncbi:MAG: hypothetical protein JO283_04625 [Bradyrhizobium sp.]|nr:hypothetical protein [Bradyrhizobium sp.]